MLLLFDTDVAGALGEQPVSAGLDCLNLEVPILIADGGVVSTLLLVFCDQLDRSFLDGLASGFFENRALQHALSVFLWGQILRPQGNREERRENR